MARQDVTTSPASSARLLLFPLGSEAQRMGQHGWSRALQGWAMLDGSPFAAALVQASHHGGHGCAQRVLTLRAAVVWTSPGTVGGLQSTSKICNGMKRVPFMYPRFVSLKCSCSAGSLASHPLHYDLVGSAWGSQLCHMY